MTSRRIDAKEKKTVLETDYEDDYYAHHCRRCGGRLDEDHSCDATDYDDGTS
jgi:hypothetical protein